MFPSKADEGIAFMRKVQGTCSFSFYPSSNCRRSSQSHFVGCVQNYTRVLHSSAGVSQVTYNPQHWADDSSHYFIIVVGAISYNFGGEVRTVLRIRIHMGTTQLVNEKTDRRLLKTNPLLVGLLRRNCWKQRSVFFLSLLRYDQNRVN